ncbi:MAG TPA: hypothetical protein VFM29_07215, partial [Vicinamibacteria bacterium]|nr:hypothetical protein [Vicinamibacteria bacterium]
ERSHRWPRALPGGKAILYTVGLGGSWDNARVVAHRLDTGERKVVIEGGIDARYVPTGHLAYVRGTSIYAVAFDPETLQASGQPFEVVTGVANHSAGGAEFDFSEKGILVYFSPGVGGDEGGRLVLLSGRGEPQPARLPEMTIGNPRFSPDGTSIVGEREWSVWTFDITRGVQTRVASGSRTGWPVWSPDGRQVFYGSERTGPWQVWSRAADGGDEERQVSRSPDSVVPHGISPDGKELIVRVDRKVTGADIDLIEVATGTARSFVATEADEYPGTFSPDGRFIAYASDDSGRTEVYVRPREGPGRWQVSNEGGVEPRWVRPDEIAYLNGTRIMVATVKTAPRFTASAPRLLLDRNASDFDLDRAGRILIVEPPDPSAAPGRLNVVVNWFEEIRRR